MPTKKKKPRPSKYDKPLSLSGLGDNFEDVVRTILKSQPMPKPKKKRTGRKKAE